MYHNVRDKYGRFSKKKRTTKKVVKNPVARKPKVKDILSVFLLDDSSSMSPKRDVTISGFNELLVSGQLDAARNKMRLHERMVKFGSPYNEVWHENIQSLTGYTYNPQQGRTALWDAVGFAIQRAEKVLMDFPSNTQVLLTIFTDGEENASRIWNEGTIKARIQQKQAEGWTITFVGAGDKAQVEKVAVNVGIFASNISNYVNTSAGTQAAFANVVRSRSLYTKKVSQGEAVTDGFFAK